MKGGQRVAGWGRQFSTGFPRKPTPLRGVPDGKEEEEGGRRAPFGLAAISIAGSGMKRTWADDRSVTAPVAVHDRERERERRIFSRYHPEKEQRGGRNKVGVKFLDGTEARSNLRKGKGDAVGKEG